MKGKLVMTIKPYTTVHFGDYSATKNGNTVYVKDKNNNVQVMKTKDFWKFLAKNVPIITTQPDTDTFIHTLKNATNYDQSTIDSILNKYQIIYNPLTGKKEYIDLSKIMYD